MRWYVQAEDVVAGYIGYARINGEDLSRTTTAIGFAEYVFYRNSFKAETQVDCRASTSWLVCRLHHHEPGIGQR